MRGPGPVDRPPHRGPARVGRETPAAVLLAVLALTPLAAACGGGKETSSGAGGDGFDMESAEFAPELGVDLDAMERLPSGLYVQDLVEGEGREAVNRSPIFVHYTGWLPDGTEFDSSSDRGPFSFMVGMEQVIPGWDRGVVGMKPGGVRRLVIPPELGYGAHGAGEDIPPSTPLVFEIEALDVLPPAPLGPTGVDTVSAGDTVPGGPPR